jgi:dTDP-4-dehydrorhamnose 3,5-epimerase
MSEKFTIKIETHKTKDIKDGHTNGSLSVIWRDWDKKIDYEPRMVYVSTVNINEIKGPHIHTKRNSYFTCIHGKVVFIIKDTDGKFYEIESGEENPIIVFVPKNIPSAHINISDKSSSILALADVAWKPDDSEMVNVTFDDYNWKKWIRS